MEKQPGKSPVVNCPQCGETVIWEKSNRYRPFCSERCKLIDLGRWATDTYKIPDEDKPQENNP